MARTPTRIVFISASGEMCRVAVEAMAKAPGSWDFVITDTNPNACVPMLANAAANPIRCYGRLGRPPLSGFVLGMGEAIRSGGLTTKEAVDFSYDTVEGGFGGVHGWRVASSGMRAEVGRGETTSTALLKYLALSTFGRRFTYRGVSLMCAYGIPASRKHVAQRRFQLLPSRVMSRVDDVKEIPCTAFFLLALDQPRGRPKVVIPEYSAEPDALYVALQSCGCTLGRIFPTVLKLSPAVYAPQTRTQHGRATTHRKNADHDNRRKHCGVAIHPPLSQLTTRSGTGDTCDFRRKRLVMSITRRQPGCSPIDHRILLRCIFPIDRCDADARHRTYARDAPIQTSGSRRRSALRTRHRYRPVPIAGSMPKS